MSATGRITLCYIWVALLLAGSVVMAMELHRPSVLAKELNVPLKLGNWEGMDLEMGEAALSMIRPDRHLYRLYRDGTGTMVTIYVGYYGNLRNSDLAHSPLVCYPGQGWEIRDKGGITAEVRGNTQYLATLKVQNQSDRELVYYCYRDGEMTTGNMLKLRLRLLKNLFAGRPTDAAFIRVSSALTDAGPRQCDRALRRLLNDLDPYISAVFINPA